MNRKKREALVLKVLGVALLCSPMLLISGACEIGAYFSEGKARMLGSSGVVTTATVFKVTKDTVGEVLQTTSEHKRNVKSALRSDLQHWTLHYRFSTAENVEIKGSYNVSTYEKPDTGGELEIRYLPSDPTVYEKGIGHTKSQFAAFHWIAFAFACIWLATVFGALVKELIPSRQTTRDKRIARQKELEAAGS